MSIVRAFTTRRKRPESAEEQAMPSRLTKSPSRAQPAFDRPMISKISSPVLLSTTNVHTYNAHDLATAHKLRKVSSVSSSSSRNSDKDSDVSSTSPRSRGESVTSASSLGSTPPSPSASTLFFQQKKQPAIPPRRAASSTELRSQSQSTETSPTIPQRAPTHSKRAHEVLARKRSLQTMNFAPRDQPTSAPASRDQRTSIEMFNHNHTESLHPFGKELEQLDEVAEEFGGAVRDAEREADLDIMRRRGLHRFRAEDYIKEIEPLFVRCYHPPQQKTEWI